MRKTMRALALTLTVAALAPALASSGAGLAETAATFPMEVVGAGPKLWLACTTCLVGGIVAVASGWGAIIIAATAPGSALVLAGCIMACAAM